MDDLKPATKVWWCGLAQKAEETDEEPEDGCYLAAFDHVEADWNCGWRWLLEEVD